MDASKRPARPILPLVRNDCLTFHRKGRTLHAFYIYSVIGLSRWWDDSSELGVTVHIDGRSFDVEADFDATFSIWNDWKRGAV